MSARVAALLPQGPGPASERPRVGLATADHGLMDCRPGCAACCIAPSISTPIPALALGAVASAKPAGVACPQLLPDLRCALFGRPERPSVCASLRPQPAMCGDSREQAMHWLATIERDTAPAAELRRLRL